MNVELSEAARGEVIVYRKVFGWQISIRLFDTSNIFVFYKSFLCPDFEKLR